MIDVTYDLYFWHSTPSGLSPVDLAEVLAQGGASAIPSDASVLAFPQAVRADMPDVADGMG